jgi:hypothetical protein
MLSVLFLLFAVVHVAIWLWTFREWQRLGRPVALSLILFGNLLLWYDNFRIGIGRFLGEGELLYALTIPAFLWHWTILPLLVIVAGSIARMAGFAWAQNKLVMGAFCLVAVWLFSLDAPYAMGLLFGDVGPFKAVTMAPACLADTLRYTTTLTPFQFCTPDAVARSVGPGPFVAIFMNAIMLALGILIWVKRGWKWLALGPGAMFIAAGAGGSLPYGLPLANFGEILFTLGVTATVVHFARQRAAGLAAQGRAPQPGRPVPQRGSA